MTSLRTGYKNRMDRRFPEGASPFGTAWGGVRRQAPGPLGCLLMLLCFPFAVVGLLVLAAVTAWRTRKLRKQFAAAARAAAEHGAAEPLVAFVRAMAIDPEFTRDEALQAGVAASAGRSAAELLDEALVRGWVEDRGDGRYAVTAAGRARAADDGGTPGA